MASNAAPGGIFKTESLRKMVYPRVFSSPVIIGNQIYVVGGCDQMGQPVDSFEVYDVNKNKWTSLQNMPTKRAAPAVGVVGDQIIVIGGVGDAQQPVSAVECYNIKDKKWTEMESLPSGRLGISTVLRDGKVLAVGGNGADTNPFDAVSAINVEENKVGKDPCLALEVFDFQTEKWRQLPPVPSKRVFAMYAATDKHIFSIGGLIQPGNKGFSDACEVFDLEKEEWKIGKSLPTRRGDFAITVIAGKVVCAGGLGNKGAPMDVVELYDVVEDEWSTAPPMPLAHCSCAFIQHGGKLYIFGGLSPQGPTNCAEKISYLEEGEEESGKRAAGKAGNKKKNR
ncbi:KLD8B-like protein [Mya arenaria]|uniref:KLD8B-like protein n=1 Tax=Mya arenaria TaxID=6604 RepID=A0ABY7DZH7_MYAAR|nr:KLD8B-like protein [Mya arenaria]